MKQRNIGQKENQNDYGNKEGEDEEDDDDEEEEEEEENEEESETEAKNKNNNFDINLVKNEQIFTPSPSDTELWNDEEEGKIDEYNFQKQQNIVLEDNNNNTQQTQQQQILQRRWKIEQNKTQQQQQFQQQNNCFENNNNVFIEQQQQTDQTEIYRELILRHLIADISGTCTKLGLSTELSLWSEDDSRRWVVEMCNQFQIQVPPSESFVCLNGQRMLSLGVEEFQQRFPDGGDTLHAQLQLWKTAFESCGQHQQQHQFIETNQNRGDWTLDNNITQPPVAVLTGYNNIPVGSSISPSSSSICSSSTSSSQQFVQPNVLPNSTRRQQQQPSNRVYQQSQHYQAVQQYPAVQHQQYYNNHRTTMQQFPSSYPPLQHFSGTMLSEHNHLQRSGNGLMLSSGIQQHCITSSPSDDCSASESVSPTTTLRQDDTCSVGDEEQQHINQLATNNPTITTQQTYFINENDKAKASAALYTSNVEPCGLVQKQTYHYNNNTQQQQHRSYNNTQNLQHLNPRHQQRIIAAQNNSSNNSSSGTIHLWHFIRELLDRPKDFEGCVRWVNREDGTFKIESSHHLARYWGIRKNRAAMNYDKLSRSLRQYYKKGIIQKPEKKQRLVYKFLPPYNH